MLIRLHSKHYQPSPIFCNYLVHHFVLLFQLILFSIAFKGLDCIYGCNEEYAFSMPSYIGPSKMRLVLCGWSLLLLIGLMTQFGFGDRILFMAPICFRSHKHSFMPIAEALAAKGHQVTVITPFQPKDEVENIREIVVEDFMGGETSVDWFKLQQQGRIAATFNVFSNFRRAQRAGYKGLMARKEFQDIIRNRDVDLAIVLAVMNDFTMPIIDHLAVPFIVYSATISVPWLMTYVGADQEYATFPAFGTSYTNRMSFKERTANLLTNEIALICRRMFVLWMLDDLAKEDFPNLRSISQIERDAQLLLVNYHQSIAWQRPFPPTVIPVPGLHLRPLKPLPKDLEDFASGAKEGFIVFTLGSVIPVSSMPSHIVDMFVRVFSRIPQRVFWKWEKGSIAGKLSDNVMVLDWLPQQYLLRHKKAKLFISHGGLLGIQEALSQGVPILGLPFGNDQRGNLAKATEEGYALKLDWITLSEEGLFQAIQALITQPSFRGNATRLSRLMKDEPLPAKDVAVHWIEHVLRHEGTKHLQSSAKEMPIYQVYLLDVWVFLISLFTATFFISFKVLSWALHKCCSTNKIKTN